MNKIFDFEVLDPKGRRLMQHKAVELDPKSCYFYALRLKQRYGIRPMTVRWKEKGTEEWITLDPNK